MQKFSDPISFERELTSIADAIFVGRGDVRHEESVGFGFDAWRLDYVLDLKHGAHAGRYVFEFKYSNYPTLPESLIRSLVARFSSLRSANPGMDFTCVIVTNGNAPVDENQFPPYIKIIAGVQSGEQWRSKLCETFLG